MQTGLDCILPEKIENGSQKSTACFKDTTQHQINGVSVFLKAITKISKVGSSLIDMSSNPKLEKRKASSIAFIEHRGPYDKVPWEEYIERLYNWAKEQKVMPGFYPMGIYHDNPEEVPAEQCGSNIAITFKGGAAELKGIKIGKLPDMTVASLSHKGPGSEFKNTYSKLSKWIKEKGYVVSGSPIEVYSKKPEVVNGVTILYAKVMIPVKKR